MVGSEGVGWWPTKSLLKKSPTSSVVEGPPIFMKTIAVGPFELVASCVTGGTGIANDRSWFAPVRCHSGDGLVSFVIVDCDALLVSWFMGARKAIVEASSNVNRENVL
jgi:hypothetical protein